MVKNDFGSFDLTTINSTGDKKINYKIKNKITSYSKKNAEKLISIDLDTVKIKNIKEKNIKNEITKYQIQISTSLNFEEINTDKSGEIKISKTGDYSVAKQYSQTLNNEKQLIEPPDVRNLVHLRRTALARHSPLDEPVLLGQVTGHDVAVPLQR